MKFIEKHSTLIKCNQGFENNSTQSFLNSGQTQSQQYCPLTCLLNPSQCSHLYGVLILHRTTEVVPQALISGLVLVWRVRGLWRRRRVGACSARRAGRARLFPLHQQRDGGWGAGKQRYCLVMSGFCHVYTIDLKQQSHTTAGERRVSGVSKHPAALS